MSAMPAAALAAPHAALLFLHPAPARAAAALRSAASGAAARLGIRRRPRISVITPTWHRPGLLAARCVPSVAAQTWTPAEHIVVCDGPDPALAALPGLPPVHYLPAHVSSASRGVYARAAGAGLATGELVAYLDDDNSWRPEHLELLAAALLDYGADFAYSRALCHAGHLSWEIGRAPPCYTQIDTSLIVHRRELLAVAAWQPAAPAADWDLVSRWLSAGAAWAFVPRVTLNYYAADGPVAAGLG